MNAVPDDCHELTPGETEQLPLEDDGATFKVATVPGGYDVPAGGALSDVEGVTDVVAFATRYGAGDVAASVYVGCA
jgi:hypothetical protein